MDIPVFHDDQHGTAIVSAAALINAFDLTGRRLTDVKMVVNGAGAAAIACLELIISMGLPPAQALLCDSCGVIYRGRNQGMNQWKEAHAIDTKARSLADAMRGADVFLGLSVKDAVTPEMVASMAAKPIILAMANPDPEIRPEAARAVRPDAIIATGRSDYPNQVNNVLGFPYIFRGALDVRAHTINEAMKIPAVEAIAKLARADVPDEVDEVYAATQLRYGPEYIIPVPFDPRLIECVPPAVARAAVDSGVAGRSIADFNAYGQTLRSRLDPTASAVQFIHDAVRKNPQRVVFAEGEEEKTIRAAHAFQSAGLGTPILIGREDLVRQKCADLGLDDSTQLRINNARLDERRHEYTDSLYQRLQRKGETFRDCQRLVNQNRNVFAACMVAASEADAMVTGLTRGFYTCFSDVRRVFDANPSEQVFGLTVIVTRAHTLFIADTSVHEHPDAGKLTDIAVQSAEKARQMGHGPQVAFLSFSNFGNPKREAANVVRDAVALMGARTDVDFHFDGEMTADMALDPELRERFYPFARITGAANVLIMPGLHAAHIVSRILQQVGGTTIGPILMGLSQPVQILQMRATVNETVNAAALAAHEAIRRSARKSADAPPIRGRRKSPRSAARSRRLG